MTSKQAARYPRIIIDPALLSVHLRHNSLLRHTAHDYNTEISHIRKLIRKDSDGYHFVDYLKTVETEFNDPELDYPKFLETHRNQIVSALDKFRLHKRVLEKYQWLKAYHNETVKNRFTKRMRIKHLI